jgi:WD40 repeat protein
MNNNIYIADTELHEIKKFSSNGDFITKMGRKGQGPGEFEEITAICSDDSSNVFAFDRNQMRITVFSGEGQYKKTIRLNISTWFDAKRLIVSNNQILVFGTLGNDLELFHRFDNSGKKINSFGKYEFIQNEKYEKMSLNASPGYFCIVNSDEIIYTRDHYDNTIFIYNNDRLNKIIVNNLHSGPPYLVEDISTYEDVRKKMKTGKYNFSVMGSGKFFVGSSLRTSIGIYQLNSGNIIHIISKKKEKRVREYGIELYNQKMQLLGYYPIGENFEYIIKHKDNADNIYAYSNYPEPVIYKLKLTN